MTTSTMPIISTASMMTLIGFISVTDNSEIRCIYNFLQNSIGYIMYSPCYDDTSKKAEQNESQKSRYSQN